MGCQNEGFKVETWTLSNLPNHPPSYIPGMTATPIGGRAFGNTGRKTFVGRAAELELFRQALHAERPAFQVLAVGRPSGLRARRRCLRGLPRNVTV